MPNLIAGQSKRNIVLLGVVQFLIALILAQLFSGCQQEVTKESTLFTRLGMEDTGIDFSNTLVETEEWNFVQYLNYDNGGGVAVGDINNDGLQDIYFTANELPNRLYLNKGGLKFKDITEQAGVSGKGDWSMGVTMADVNGDGFLDIYVCYLAEYKGLEGHNELFINNGDLTFTESAKSFGLDFAGYSTHSSFFDYDNDGDLDMYLLNHSMHSDRTFGRSSLRFDMDPKAGDRLYRNESQLGNQVFSDVTMEAGIYSSQIGYGLGIAVSDVNNDGWMDIYISNDFHENDYLYLNNGDGTFSESIRECMGHSTRSSMGNDIADFNNDGLQDIMTLDMHPEDERIRKTTVRDDPWDIYNLKLSYGYYYQFARNVLQLNIGISSDNRPLYSDIAYLAGVYATDWSWAPLFCDLDMDGWKDLFISNGIYRRPNDLDYIKFTAGANIYESISPDYSVSDLEITSKMPTHSVANYAYKNNGDLTFDNQSVAWGLGDQIFSNGAAYADFDNDGDPDIVVNNMNDYANIFRNESDKVSDAHYLKIRLQSQTMNRRGIGSKIYVYGNGNVMKYEQVPSRGFLSSVSDEILVGLGNIEIIDSVKVVWPGGKSQVLFRVKADQTLILKHQDAIRETYSNERHIGKVKTLFEEITDRISIPYTHKEDRYAEFDSQPLIPHRISTEGPAMAVGDVNSDGLTDIFLGGAMNQPGIILIQQDNGDFVTTDQPALSIDNISEDVDAVFFDSDGDNDLDLYVMSGGNAFAGRVTPLSDRLYLNDGKGFFSRAYDRLPSLFENGGVVKVADYDLDGDTDLFLGTRVIAGYYGMSPTSYLLENNGKGFFSNVTPDKIPGLKQLGLVTDAAWSDIDGDRRTDLIIVGEWMPVTIFLNKESGFVNATNDLGFEKTNGWWNTLITKDLDGDGDVDLVVGNLGLNSRLTASEAQPLEMYLKDFDNNGSVDPIICYYNGKESYPLVGLDYLSRQMSFLNRRYFRYTDFSASKITEIFTPEQLSDTDKKYAYQFQSCIFLNKGDQGFEMKVLPLEAQFAPVQSILAGDFNKDGKTDLMIAGNFYGVEADISRYDASRGLILSGDGQGKFRSINPLESGFLVSGEVRQIHTIYSRESGPIILIAKNKADLQVFQLTDELSDR